MTNNQPTYLVKMLADMPAVSTGRGAKYSGIVDAMVKECQPGWGLFVEGEKGCSDKELAKLAASLRTSFRHRGIKARRRTDFSQRGVWIWLVEHEV